MVCARCERGREQSPRELLSDSVAERGDIYGQINDAADMSRVFKSIREEVSAAESRPILTELYRRAGYLITLTYAPSWWRSSGCRKRIS